MADMSAPESKRSARQAKAEHEAKLQRQILDWIEVQQPKDGNVLVLRVPDDRFIQPGTKAEDITDEQRATMEACHQVLRTVLTDLGRAGVRMGGAAILAESMKLEDLPPPPQMQGRIHAARSPILLPPGTKV